METIERNEIFDLAYRFITETNESIFLTGKAGTGKTTFLKYLRDQSAKNMIVAAPTGVAAINAGGVTLHSLFQLPFQPYLPTEGNRLQLLQNIRYNKQRINLLRKMELLVIDEISMVRCDTLDAIDSILKSVRQNRQEPFGGVQILFIGDLFQLPPVAKREEWNILNQYYDSPFFFDSKAIKEQTPLLIELNKIYRQKEESFVELLNKVRNNQMEMDDFEKLNNRYFPGFQPSAFEKYITLTTHNIQAENINQFKLQNLTTGSFTFTATIEGEFPEHVYPADANLVLKEGAQVMFIKNDPVTKKYFNGKIGVVSKLEQDKIMVDCDGVEIEVYQEVWENIRYTLNKTDEKLEQQVLGNFLQYPLRLAWAITIHKSQGLTFGNLMIDAASSFSSGQVYVALSRCTSLEGIVLLSKIPSSAILSNHHVANAQSSLTPKGSLAERFEGARQVFTVQLLSEIFLMDELLGATNLLQSNIQKHHEKLNPDAVQWVKDFVDRLKKEKAIAEKFVGHIFELMKAERVIENNQPLQKRIQDAAGYFLPLLTNLKEQLQQHPLVTDHKEVATAIDESLQELIHAFVKAIYLMQYCLQAFVIPDFLKHKLNLAIPKIKMSSYAANKSQPVSTDTPNPELYQSLKIWRDKICAENYQPIYMVANSASLKEICTHLPTTPAKLQLINGFGKAKSDKYGEDIIELVTDYCSQYGLESNMELLLDVEKKKPKKSTKNKEDKIPSAVISLQFFQQGKTIAEIAEERKLSSSTISGHLIEFIKTGEIEVAIFVDEQKLKLISQSILQHPDKKHGEIKSILADQFSFIEIKAVANHLLWKQTAVSLM